MNDKGVNEQGLRNVNRLERELSGLRNVQANRGRTMLDNLDLSIDRYTKNLYSRTLRLKELEECRLSHAAELANIEREAETVTASSVNKIKRLKQLIKNAEDDLNAMLQEKERHQRALDAANEQVRFKYDSLMKHHINRFHDAEAVYTYKKLMLTKKAKDLEAQIEATSQETNEVQQRLNNLKTCNRELRTRYQELQKR